MRISEGLRNSIFHYITDPVHTCSVVKFCCPSDDALLSDILILIINEITESSEFIRCMHKYIIDIMQELIRRSEENDYAILINLKPATQRFSNWLSHSCAIIDQY